MQIGKFNVLLDLQFGSCGKGKFTPYIAHLNHVQHVSGSNRSNAGHTSVYKGQRYVFKVLPSAAALYPMRDERLTCWLSPGAAFFPEQLDREFEMTGLARDSVIIHEHAQLLTAADIHNEKLAVGEIASTLQGSGFAQAKKVLRSSDVQLARGMMGGAMSALMFRTEVHRYLDAQTPWLHEAAQGWGLSLDHGLYPYVTSRNCGTHAALDQMGVNPRLLGDVYGVFRPYPIRVGNLGEQSSGPAYSGSGELNWKYIAEGAGMPADELHLLKQREKTTVTGRQRRVFQFSEVQLHDAVMSNGVNQLILNFAQYIDWKVHRVKTWSELTSPVRSFIDRVEKFTSCRVAMVGTGEDFWDVVHQP